MSQKEILELFNKVGAIITDSHIVYTSGKHGTAYINKDALFPHNKETSKLCRIIAQKFVKDDVHAVIGPAVGGAILSQWTAYHLSELAEREVLGVYADKVEERFVIKRGYDKLIANKNVLVVEDVLTTGGSVKKVINATHDAGGNVIGLGVLCNRGNVTTKDLADVPKLFSLVNVNLESWDEADCPLCVDGVPINTDVGKGREFLARQGG
ncbi:MAG: phosphoribosyltransferase family protein [bacterium]